MFFLPCRVLQISIACLIGAVMAGFSHPSFADPYETRKEAIARVAKYSEEELISRLEEIFEQKDPRWHVDYELCLLEILKRNNPDWVDFLQEQLSDLESKVHPGDADPDVSGKRMNLELLTVLSRAQGKPDPLSVIVEPLENTTLDPTQLPRLTVSLKNTSETSVGVSIGGNYRSGRLTRWRLDVKDSMGNRLPVKPWPIGVGGGLMSFNVVPPGEQLDETELILEHIIQFDKPGRYTAQVVYHNQHNILAESSLDGFIVSTSEPFEIEIQPVSIGGDDAVEENIESLIDELDEARKVHLLIGKYGQWADDFINKDSPQGQLLQIGLPAVPQLIERLEQESTSQELAAHLLGMLFTITGQNDPRIGRPLGSYKYLSEGWSVKNSVSVGQGSGSHSPGAIKHEDQQQLIRRWVAWKKHMIVKPEE